MRHFMPRMRFAAHADDRLTICAEQFNAPAPRMPQLQTSHYDLRKHSQRRVGYPRSGYVIN